MRDQFINLRNAALICQRRVFLFVHDRGTRARGTSKHFVENTLRDHGARTVTPRCAHGDTVLGSRSRS